MSVNLCYSIVQKIYVRTQFNIPMHVYFPKAIRKALW